MWRNYPVLQPDDLRKIAASTLVIIGERDVINISHARQMANFLPKGLLKIIPGGHFGFVTHPFQVNEAIAAFLGI